MTDRVPGSGHMKRASQFQEPSLEGARMRRPSTTLAIGIIAVMSAALAACGSSSKPAGSAPSSGSAGTSSAPIKLMVIGELSSPAISAPQLGRGAQAAINSVNAAGGVNGHKLELLSCNTQTDPNVAAGCAR